MEPDTAETDVKIQNNVANHTGEQPAQENNRGSHLKTARVRFSDAQHENDLSKIKQITKNVQQEIVSVSKSNNKASKKFKKKVQTHQTSEQQSNSKRIKSLRFSMDANHQQQRKTQSSKSQKLHQFVENQNSRKREILEAEIDKINQQRQAMVLDESHVNGKVSKSRTIDQTIQQSKQIVEQAKIQQTERADRARRRSAKLQQTIQGQVLQNQQPKSKSKQLSKQKLPFQRTLTMLETIKEAQHIIGTEPIGRTRASDRVHGQQKTIKQQNQNQSKQNQVLTKNLTMQETVEEGLKYIGKEIEGKTRLQERILRQHQGDKSAIKSNAPKSKRTKSKLKSNVKFQEPQDSNSQISVALRTRSHTSKKRNPVEDLTEEEKNNKKRK